MLSPFTVSLDDIAGFGIQVDACDLDGSIMGMTASKSYNLYSYLGEEKCWKSGLIDRLGYHGWDRCWLCLGHSEHSCSKHRIEVNKSFSIEMSLSLRFSCIIQVDVKNLMLIGDNLIILWRVFYYYVYKFSFCNCLSETLSSPFLMAWGTGGVGFLELAFYGSQLLIKKVADETSCMSYSLCNWFGRDVCNESTSALLFCIFQHKTHLVITQRIEGGYM